MKTQTIICIRPGTSRPITFFLTGDRKGPWQVADTINERSWYIVNLDTRRYKRIGPAKWHGVNYFDEACVEADKRNTKINAAE